MHILDAELLRRPVRVLVVGCGGTGCAIAGGLPYLHTLRLEKQGNQLEVPSTRADPRSALSNGVLTRSAPGLRASRAYEI